MNDSYMGQFLVVDLNDHSFKTVPVPEWLKKEFVGGKGFGAKLLYDLAPAGVDAFAPENPLMFLTGPLTGTASPSMRACVVTKSPATGTYLDSFFGGRFGQEIKYAGYDGIILVGRSETPVYLAVEDDKVTFNSAEGMRGMGAITANEAMKKEQGAPDACAVTIGPAGENKVRYALICCEYNRQAGRGGAGAVMGAKNLKGIVVKGRRVVRLHDLKAFSDAAREGCREIEGSQECRELTEAGTSYVVPWSSEVGTLPYRNFKEQNDPKAESIGDMAQRKHLFMGKAACMGCPIRCSQMGAIRTGKYAHQVTDIVEYESAAMIGSNLLIHDVRAVAHLVKLCDEYGMDSISAGAVLGFVFEAVEKGAVDQPGGPELKFGNVAAAESLLKAIAFREGELGDLLAEGVKRASEKIGKDSDAYAVHVKGLECPGWAVRGTPGMGLAYMMSDRGACHQRGFMTGFEVGGVEYNGKPVDTYAVEGKAEILKGEQDYLSGTDSLVKCDFGSFGVSAGTYARMLSTATGFPASEAVFANLGEKIWNLTRLFNLREGITAADDRLPRRYVEEALSGGPHKGQRISEEDMAYMKADYYRVRGWDNEGRPTEETLERVGLSGMRTFSLNSE